MHAGLLIERPRQCLTATANIGVNGLHGRQAIAHTPHQARAHLCQRLARLVCSGLCCRLDGLVLGLRQRDKALAFQLTQQLAVSLGDGGANCGGLGAHGLHGGGCIWRSIGSMGACEAETRVARLCSLRYALDHIGSGDYTAIAVGVTLQGNSARRRLG